MFPQAYDNQGAFTDYLQYTSLLWLTGGWKLRQKKTTHCIIFLVLA